MLFVGVGFCGGLTSFSTFIVDVAGLFRAGTNPIALSMLVVTVVGATAVASVGFRLAKDHL